MKEGSGFAKRVTKENLKEFLPLLKKENYKEEKKKKKEIIENPAVQAAERIFKGEKIKIKRAFKQINKKTVLKEVHPGPWVKGVLVWVKPKLFASDVQRQPGHVTGGVRLTQAKWRHEGKLIDKTKYFRETVFGNFEWVETRKDPFVEAANIVFRVKILDHDHGLITLKVSHKPSGHAFEKNYTTQLHWGPLSSKIRDLNLTNKSFKLYAPKKGREPFSIIIE